MCLKFRTEFLLFSKLSNRYIAFLQTNREQLLWSLCAQSKSSCRWRDGWSCRGNGTFTLRNLIDANCSFSDASKTSVTARLHKPSCHCKDKLAVVNASRASKHFLSVKSDIWLTLSCDQRLKRILYPINSLFLGSCDVMFGFNREREFSDNWRNNSRPRSRATDTVFPSWMWASRALCIDGCLFWWLQLRCIDFFSSCGNVSPCFRIRRRKIRSTNCRFRSVKRRWESSAFRKCKLFAGLDFRRQTKTSTFADCPPFLTKPYLCSLVSKNSQLAKCKDCVQAQFKSMWRFKSFRWSYC